jgi:NAD(P)H-flavin reductase
VVRVGGSFTWPPTLLDPNGIHRLVLIAAGVGINPLISIFSHLIRGHSRPKEIHFIYGTKTDSDLDPQRILFLPRLMDLVAAESDSNVTMRLFLTGTGSEEPIEHGKLPNQTFPRRMSQSDLVRAIDGYGPENHDRSSTVCYVCGPARMTDETVAFLKQQKGMSQDRVLCEKWW